jgi:hypothetical protein
MGDEQATSNDYHGYHERSRNKSGLQMDSAEAAPEGPKVLAGVYNSMRLGTLEVVARDGIGPCTPADNT